MTTVNMDEPLPEITPGGEPHGEFAEGQPALAFDDLPGPGGDWCPMTLAHLVEVLKALTIEQYGAVIREVTGAESGFFRLETKLEELTALLCTEPGQDVVIETIDALQVEIDSLRAALAAKDAAYKDLDDRYTFALNEHEEEMERATTECTVHNDSVHGAEAEQLRSRLEKLTTGELRRILDDVDACDSLAALK